MSLEAWGDEGDVGIDGYVTEEYFDEVVAEKDAEIERLRATIVWALGYTDFSPREEGDKPFWWRKELREKSGLTPEDCWRIAASVQSPKGEKG